MKTVRTVKTADILKLINGQRRNEDGTIDRKEDEDDIVYFDEAEGLYYDASGNLLEFNPDDYIIECDEWEGE